MAATDMPKQQSKCFVYSRVPATMLRVSTYDQKWASPSLPILPGFFFRRLVLMTIVGFSGLAWVE